MSAEPLPAGYSPRAALLLAEARRLGLAAAAADSLLAQVPRPSVHRLDWGGVTIELSDRTRILALLDARTVRGVRGTAAVNEFTVQMVAERGDALVGAGADIIEIGVWQDHSPLERREPDECTRIRAAVAAVARHVPDVPLAVHTRQATVAEIALDAGAQAIHTECLPRDLPALAAVAARRSVPLILSQWGPDLRPADLERWGPAKLVAQLVQGLEEQVQMAVAAGCRREQLVVDPGLGLGKSLWVDPAVVRELKVLSALQLPVTIGDCWNPGFMGRWPPERDESYWATATAAIPIAIANGASLIRVPTLAWQSNAPTDQVETLARLARVVRMTDAIVRAPLDE